MFVRNILDNNKKNNITLYCVNKYIKSCRWKWELLFMKNEKSTSTNIGINVNNNISWSLAWLADWSYRVNTTAKTSTPNQRPKMCIGTHIMKRWCIQESKYASAPHGAVGHLNIQDPRLRLTGRHPRQTGGSLFGGVLPLCREIQPAFSIPPSARGRWSFVAIYFEILWSMI